MDGFTLRVTFSLVAVTLLVLFYLTTYRSTHAAFCGWWCISLVLFVAAGVVWLLDVTQAPGVGVPLGNALGVSGATAVWLAARSLERPHPPWWVLAAGPTLTAIAGALNHPARNVWSGGLVFLAAMTIFFALAAWEIGRASRAPSSPHSPTTAALAILSVLVAVFYLGRTVAFAAFGPDNPLSVQVFGTTTTALLMTMMLVAVSHSMGALSQEQVVRDLRRRAERDDLTGLLNREAFGELANEAIRTSQQSAVIMADLDNFKSINDFLGHPVGDAVIHAFADTLQQTVRSTDVAARFGGDEFVVLMPGAGPEVAAEAAHTMSRKMRERYVLSDDQCVRASYGIAVVEGGVDLATALRRADEALYRAKNAGGDQVALYGDD